MGNVLDCKLLQGTAAFVAQLLLGILALGALVYKRFKEVPQRPLDVWTLDVTKQVISTGAAHFCGMLIALVASAHTSGSTSECSWYFVAFTFDTSLGVLITIGLHRAAISAAARLAASHPKAVSLDALATCGFYGSPVQLWRWALQLAEWTAAVIAARAVVGCLVVGLQPALLPVARGIDAMYAGRPTALLFSVMVACPLLMNTLQLLVQDAVLKWKRVGGGGGGGPFMLHQRSVPGGAADSPGIDDSIWDEEGGAGGSGHGPVGERTGLLPPQHSGSGGGRPGSSGSRVGSRSNSGGSIGAGGWRT